MPRPAITWVITDTHFFHDDMMKFCGRPERCERIVMRNLKHSIAPQDLLIHLGDVVFYQYTKLKEMMDYVPCRKVLTMGNHDHKSRGWYMRNGFDFVMDAFVLGNVVFSHKPMEVLPSGTKYNVHGHLHLNVHRVEEEWYDVQVHRNLSLELVEYKPVNLKKFLPGAEW